LTAVRREPGPHTLSHDEYDEVVSRLERVRRLAQQLVDVFSESAGARGEATRGAQAMLESIERILAILGADSTRSK
jgi:hypothetical protein